MKTGVEAYEEVSAMQKIDVLEIMASDAYEATYERSRVSGRRHAADDLAESSLAQSVVKNLIEASRDEVRRSSLTSLPLINEFMKEMGFASRHEVDAWMLHVRRRFISALEKIA